MLDQQKVCIIIPFYNGDTYIAPCLESIQANNYPFIEICIINNSTHPTKVHELAGVYNNVTIIDTSPAIGFGRANNKGAEFALSIGADYLIILNQDTILTPSCISALIKPFKDDAHISITAPISFTYNFHEIEEHFIRWYLVQCPQLFYDALINKTKDYYLMKEVSGACIALKAGEVKKFGLFDPLYFMYMEDMDLCRKINFLNRKIVLVPSAKIAHAHSNTNEDKNKRRQIAKSTRRSRGIFLLKEINKPVLFNIGKFLRVSLEENINALTHFKFAYLISFVFIDIRVLMQINQIFKSRKNELLLSKKFLINEKEAVSL